MNKKTQQIVLSILKFALGLVVISPILLSFSMSLMNQNEFRSIPPSILPKDFLISNYTNVLQTFPVFRYLLNTVIMYLIVIISQVITCGAAAYGFSFFEFKGKKLLFMAVLSTMMIPAEATIIANYLTISKLRLTDTYIGLVFPYLTSAMGIFLLRQFFLTVPKEIKEAATIDGCGEMRFISQILLPIAKPVIASLAIYQFISVYNQYFWALLVTNTETMRPIQIGLSILLSSETGDFGPVLAGSTLVLLPVLFMFVVGHKYLVKGMTDGAVKG